MCHQIERSAFVGRHQCRATATVVARRIHSIAACRASPLVQSAYLWCSILMPWHVASLVDAAASVEGRGLITHPPTFGLV